MGVGPWLGIAGAAVLVVLLLYLVGAYNALVQIRANVEKAWANIDVLLKQRREELPNLVEVCKGYMTHEASTLEAVTKLRGRLAEAVTIPDKARLENDLGGLLWTLNLNAEAYPELKANQNFLKLHDRITALETAIAARREFFNDSVNLYNIRIESFPSLVAARLLGFGKMEFLAATPGERESVPIGFPPAAKG
jgi:LemA protein